MTALESITTIGNMDSGPAPQVGDCRPMAQPRCAIAHRGM